MNAPRDVADAVVHMPRAFRDRVDITFQVLLVDSGYDHEEAAVDVVMLEDALRADPECVTDWLQYSENKRSSAGWFIRRSGLSGWEVGCVGRGIIVHVSFYQDKVAACAAFIKNEIDAIRASSRSASP